MAKLLIKKNIPLKDLTTFRVGGYASYFVQVHNKKELLEVVDFAKSQNLPIFVLGGGSDILVSDEGFSGLVIKYSNAKLSFLEKGERVFVTAEAGMIWDNLVKECVSRNLQGVECLSGIPGSVGAAPIQNIGSYGQELKDSFLELNAFDFFENKFVVLQKKDCKFTYRESIFKDKKNKGRYLILNITLGLKKNLAPTLTYESLISYLKEKEIKNPTLAQVRNAVLEIRGQKLEDPKVLGNAGSFFKNPIVAKEVLEELKKEYKDIPYHYSDDGKAKLYAGWLVEKSGWRGKNYKNAKVSEKNALVILNPKGKASAKEVKDLADQISKDVYEIFKVRLEPEVQYIGFT